MSSIFSKSIVLFFCEVPFSFLESFFFFQEGTVAAIKMIGDFSNFTCTRCYTWAWQVIVSINKFVTLAIHHILIFSGVAEYISRKRFRCLHGKKSSWQDFWFECLPTTTKKRMLYNNGNVGYGSRHATKFPISEARILKVSIKTSYYFSDLSYVSYFEEFYNYISVF